MKFFAKLKEPDFVIGVAVIALLVAVFAAPAVSSWLAKRKES